MALPKKSSYLQLPEHLGPSQPAVSFVSLSGEFNICKCCSQDEWLWWDHILWQREREKEVLEKRVEQLLHRTALPRPFPGEG